MKIKMIFILPIIILASCNATEKKRTLIGTWQLLSGTIIEKGDTTTTLYGENARMIKIINETHFSFLNHDLNKGKDSMASFVAGGGHYTLKGNEYNEILEYCNDRDWEGHTFSFKVEIRNDTLIQTGTEKLVDLGIERQNIEKYVRVKK
jgi:hypothetical protein